MIPNEKKLAKTSIEYLKEPFEVGPINEVSNLYRALEEGNYSAVRRCEFQKVDPVRLHMRLLELYGNNLVTRYFGNPITSGTIEGIKNWKFTAPERYIMLTVLLEQDLRTSFGIILEQEDINIRTA